MTKRLLSLSLPIALAFAAGCKTDATSAQQPAAQPAATPPARTADPAAKPTEPGPQARPAPALPDETAQDTGGSGDWRDRRARMDKDGDGVVSDDERAAAMHGRAETMRKRLDANGDGKLTPDELATVRGRMRFDDPAALDTNHDGDISADELAAAMKARADARRNRRAGSGDPAQ
jgi:hypothetical protein